MRAIWECVSHSWAFSGEFELFEGEDGGEEGWRTLEQFLDLTKDEWIVVKRAAVMAQLQADELDFMMDLDLNPGGQQVPIPPEGLAFMQLLLHHHQHLAAEGDQVEVEDQQQQLDGDQDGGGPGDQQDGDQVEEEEQVQDQQEGDPEGDY